MVTGWLEGRSVGGEIVGGLDWIGEFVGAFVGARLGARVGALVGELVVCK
jgi:hypothetical protein